MLVETIRLSFQCTVCGTEKDKIVFPHKTSMESVDTRDLVRECSICGDLPMDIIDIVYRLKGSLYASN